MAEVQQAWSDRAIRWTTTGSVIVLAGIAAVLSYKHMYLLVRQYGENSWSAALLPVSVDGMIAVSSMTLLADSRQGRRSGFLPWALLVTGSAASLAANVAVAEPSLVGRLIAAWPSAALIGSYELLMRQVRHGAVPDTESGSAASSEAPTGSEAAHRAAEKPYRTPRVATAPNASGNLGTRGERSEEEAGRGRMFELIRSAEEPHPPGGADNAKSRRSTRRRRDGTDFDLQHRAWRWALVHRTAEGNLPPGKVIADQFGRSERWGRLVKQAGLAGRLDAVVS
ncbi:DUF2637 domain-containing protein [Spirillospora sp. CA-128828]|uniref:DUF2637 domain-containing protein n=1 Tax=Spirillospora sp. CA-128828 TaxID=3240033 RepID=UPI003D8A8C2D